MRLLHTSDWHLGRSFHREDLLEAQARFVDALIQTVRTERVDLVAVSGDIYDRALPSVDAVALCNDTLGRLAGTRARVVIISGNHDSTTRLGFGADLIDSAGIHLRTDARRCGEPVLVEDPDGLVAVYGLPYLEPDAVRGDLGCEGRGHEAVLTAAMARVRADLAQRPGARSVVLAHAFVTGAEACDSERDISVGGASSVAASVFDGVDYTGLGHLHGAQTLRPGLRYSGSPLAYSFSEAGHRKGMWLLDLPAGPGRPVRAELVPTPVERVLARLRGRLDDLLTDPSLDRHTTHYLQVVLTDPVRPRDPMERLRARFPHVMVLGFEPECADRDAAVSYAGRLRGRSDVEVAADFVDHVRSAPEPGEIELLGRALESARVTAAVG